MFVAGDHLRLAFFLRHGDGHDFAIEDASRVSGRPALLAAQSQTILVGAADAKFHGHVFRRFRHGVDAVLRFHLAIDEAPAQGRVFDFRSARECAVSLAHHERCARHAFHATGNDQLRFARLDGAGRHADGVQAGAAQTVDGIGRYCCRQTGQQRSHAAHVAVVFARLVGAAVEHVVDGGPVDGRIAGDQRGNRQRAQVVGAHAGECTAIAAKGSAHGITDKGFVHVCFLVRAIRGKASGAGLPRGGPCPSGCVRCRRRPPGARACSRPHAS